MAAQSAIVEDNIRQLYDDQFIETCAPWVIPYIGDLIGYNSIYEVASASSDSRAEVANTIGYRRRKGTLLALEQVSMDVSGRAAVAVEEFRRLITTESMRHVAPASPSDRRPAPRPRASAASAPPSTSTTARSTCAGSRRACAHAADPTPRRSKSRCTARAVSTSQTSRSICGAGRAGRWSARPRSSLGDGRYMFSPLGADMPLFSPRAQRRPFTSLTTRADVPQPIARDELLRLLRRRPAASC